MFLFRDFREPFPFLLYQVLFLITFFFRYPFLLSSTTVFIHIRNTYSFISFVFIDRRKNKIANFLATILKPSIYPNSCSTELKTRIQVHNLYERRVNNSSMQCATKKVLVEVTDLLFLICLHPLHTSQFLMLTST